METPSFLTNTGSLESFGNIASASRADRGCPSRLLRLVVALGVLAGLTSCKESDSVGHVDEGTIEGRLYSSDEIGWRIMIPDGWQPITLEQSEAAQERGRVAIERATGESIDVPGLKHLVNLRRDHLHVLQSTTEPFEEAFKGEWSETNLRIRDMLLQTYRNQGLDVAASEIETEEVGGLEFERLSMEVTLPNGDVLRQIMFSRLINGLDFGVTISYTDEGFGREILEAWRGSRFDS